MSKDNFGNEHHNAKMKMDDAVITTDYFGPGSNPALYCCLTITIGSAHVHLSTNPAALLELADMLRKEARGAISTDTRHIINL